MNSKKLKKVPVDILYAVFNILMLLFSISCIFPIIWLLNSSLKTTQEFTRSIISLPESFNIANYQAVLENGKMIIYLLNSLFVSALSVAFVVFLSFTAAYCISRIEFKGRIFIYSLYLAGMLVPVHGLLVPLFILFQKMGLYDTRFTLILPYIAIGMPMALFLMSSFIETIPIELEDAAVMDGCSVHKILLYILFPICKPIISTVIILTFLNCWNEFPFALVLLRSEKYKTISVGLNNYTGMYSVNYPQLMTALMIASLPVIIVYLLLSKKVIQGMVAGAVKG